MSLLAGIALITCVVAYSGLEGLSGLSVFHPIPFLGALAFTILGSAAVAYRWGTLVHGLNQRRIFPWKEYYRAFTAGQLAGIMIPKDIPDLGGRTVWLARKGGVDLELAAASVVLDRSADLAIAVTGLPASIAFFLGYLEAFEAVALLLLTWGLVGAASLASQPKLHSYAEKVERAVGAIPVIGKRLEGLSRYGAVRRPILARAILVTVIKFGLTSARLWLLGATFGIRLPASLILLGMPIGQVSYLFSFTPGALGVFEAGWMLVLKLGAIPSRQISTFLVGQRALTVVCIGAASLVGFLLVTSASPAEKTPG